MAEAVVSRNPFWSAPPSASGTDEETRVLLRGRLRICCWALLLCILALQFIGLVFKSEVSGQGASLVLGFWLNGGLIVVLIAALCALYPGNLPLSRLRRWELLTFGAVTVYGGVSRYAAFAGLALDPNDPDRTRVLIERQAGMANYVWYFIIIYYGVLIPNTRRRGTIVVAAMASVPLLTTVLAALANPLLWPQIPLQLAILCVGLFVSGVAAIFSAARINALRREAYEARRAAQQMGAYTLTRKLGAGGMGEVWLAEHRLLKRPCAVKFIRPEHAANPDAAKRFEREVRAVTALTHVNTVRVYDYGRADDGSFYYVMEYLDGPTLERLVKDRGPLEPGRAVYLLRQLCGALAEAHAAGLVHRDLKPSNVIVAALGGQRDVAKILDFGLVQDLSTTEGDRLTQTGVLMGTPPYMCPEQAGGSRAIDPRGDLYSLGAVAFFMLIGRPPFEGRNVGEFVAAHLTCPTPDVRTARPDVPADLAAVVARCLAKDPGDRYQSAAELGAALAACACAEEWSSDVAARWWAEPAPVTVGGA